MNLNIALKRQLGVLPNLYNAGFWHVLWVTCDVTQGDFRNMLGDGGAERLKVPPCLRPARRDYAQAGVKVLQHTQLPYGTFFINWQVKILES